METLEQVLPVQRQQSWQRVLVYFIFPMALLWMEVLV